MKFISSSHKNSLSTKWDQTNNKCRDETKKSFKNQQLTRGGQQQKVYSSGNTQQKQLKQSFCRHHTGNQISQIPLFNSNLNDDRKIPTVNHPHSHHKIPHHLICQQTSSSPLIKYSPYLNLPSLPSTVTQKLQSPSSYFQIPEYDTDSIYHKLKMGSNTKGFQTQESLQDSNMREIYSLNHLLNGSNSTKTKRSGQNGDTAQNKDKYADSQRQYQNGALDDGDFRKNHRNSNQYASKQLQPPTTKRNNDYQIQFAYSSTPNNFQPNHKQFLKQQINQKIDRVSERIDNLSRSKQKNYSKKCSKHKSPSFRQNQNKQNNYLSVNANKPGNYNESHSRTVMKSVGLSGSKSANFQKINKNKALKTPNLDYGQFYHPSSYFPLNNPNFQSQSPRKKYQLSQEIIYENQIQSHIVPKQENMSHHEFLQGCLIEMDKKLTNGNIKIGELQEELLREKQKVIKKEKQWLRKEADLLRKLAEVEYYEIQMEDNGMQGRSKEMGRDQRKYDAGQNCQSRRNQNNKSNSKSNANIIVMDRNSPIRSTLKSPLKSNPRHPSHQTSICSSCPSLLLQNTHHQIKISFLQNQLLTNHNNLKLTLEKLTHLLLINSKWKELMNRTLSEELPGTAFRVKEEMNLGEKWMQEVEKWCRAKGKQCTNEGSNSQMRAQRDQSQLNSPQLIKQMNQANPLVPFNQSQIFLLQSYCAPTISSSQIFKIPPTKRCLSKSPLKTKSPLKSKSPCLKSSNLLISQSKSSTSTTNKKHHPHVLSTNKNDSYIQQDFNKQIDSQNQLQAHHKLRRNLQKEGRRENALMNEGDFHSNEGWYHQDEVFYDRKVNQTNKSGQSTLIAQKYTLTDISLYHILSLQAISIQNLLSQQQSLSHPKNALPPFSHQSSIQHNLLFGQF